MDEAKILSRLPLPEEAQVKLRPPLFAEFFILESWALRRAQWLADMP